MQLAWKTTWLKSTKQLKNGLLVTAGLVALYIGTIKPQPSGGIGAERASGLAAVGWDPISFWQAPPYNRALEASESQVNGVIGGVPGGPRKRAFLQAGAGTVRSVQLPPLADDRKLVRTAAIDLVAKNPAASAEKIRQLAEHLGGFLVSSVSNGEEGASSASLTVRLPASRFEEARAEIQKLGLRIDSERTEAQDVTRQYVDLDARLRNLRGEEAQYLSIMKGAHSVKDALEVSEKLSNVRGEIEQQQAEFESLSKQVETVAISVSLHTEADAQVFGLNWRPLYRLKLAVREGLDSFGQYVVAMAGFIFLLPTILLWLMTILLGAALGWRILRWAGRTFFNWMPVVRIS